MFPNRTDVALTALLFLAVAAIAFSTMAINATVAGAYTLGAADGTAAGANAAAQLGARTYRIVMDPAVPLDAYAPRVEAYRAAGMRPQIVVGGTGTSVRGKTARQGQWITAYAVAAFKRWPDAYSVSVVNEPNLSGAKACTYAATFRRAYRSLKAAGASRVLFGEWSPAAPAQWTNATVGCSKAPIHADGWAWHCYDFRPAGEMYGIGYAHATHRWLKGIRGRLRTRRGNALPLYCTEYGIPTRGPDAPDQQTAAAKWRGALSVARQEGLMEIVAWGVVEAPSGAKWDTSLVDRDGNERPAFGLIASQQ